MPLKKRKREKKLQSSKPSKPLAQTPVKGYWMILKDHKKTQPWRNGERGRDSNSMQRTCFPDQP